MGVEQKNEDLDQEFPKTSEASEVEVIDLEEVQEAGGCADLLALKEEEVKQLQDRVLRTAAEMENTRKRLEREKSEGISYANESLIRELLPVIDNLERAVQHGESSSDVKSLVEGVKMTLKAFADVLAKHGCVSFDSVGQIFDPKYHEAMMQQPSDEHPEKTILLEFQKGYKLRERLLRPASVVVSKAPDLNEETE